MAQELWDKLKKHLPGGRRVRCSQCDKLVKYVAPSPYKDGRELCQKCFQEAAGYLQEQGREIR